MFDGGAMVAPNPHMDGRKWTRGCHAAGRGLGGYRNYSGLSAKMSHRMGPVFTLGGLLNNRAGSLGVGVKYGGLLSAQ